MKKILYLMMVFLIISLLGKLTSMLDTNNEIQTITTTETFVIELDDYELIF